MRLKRAECGPSRLAGEIRGAGALVGEEAPCKNTRDFNGDRLETHVHCYVGTLFPGSKKLITSAKSHSIFLIVHPADQQSRASGHLVKNSAQRNDAMLPQHLPNRHVLCSTRARIASSEEWRAARPSRSLINSSHGNSIKRTNSAVHRSSDTDGRSNLLRSDRALLAD